MSESLEEDQFPAPVDDTDALVVTRAIAALIGDLGHRLRIGVRCGYTWPGGRHHGKPPISGAFLFISCGRGNCKALGAQAHLRHTRATTTLGICTKEIPESVRRAVEALADGLFPQIHLTADTDDTNGKVH